MPQIVVCEFMDAEAVNSLRSRFEVLFDDTLVKRPADLQATLGDCEALIVRNMTQVNGELLAHAPRLRVVGRLGVGLDNIDVAECERRGIEVCSARGANATSVSEYAIAMAMLLLRGRAYLDTHRLVAGEWPREELGRGVELAGKTLGIIGLGSIGSTTARKVGKRPSW